MEAEKAFAELLNRIIEQKVRLTRLAGNTLIVYIDCDPGDLSGITIWIDPAWHFSSPESVLVGSRQILEDDTTEELDEKALPLHNVLGRQIKAVSIEERTHDICIEFENQYLLRTFVTDPNEEYSWYITDWEKRIRLYGSPKGLFTEVIENV